MTPTPQERTEQDALENEDVQPVLDWLRADTHPLAHAAAALIVSAQSRLLSLAAQSEELRKRSPNEKAKWKDIHDARNARDTALAALEKQRAEHLDHEDRAQREIQAAESRYAWEVAAHKVTAEELRRKTTLESRYTALVEECKEKGEAT